MSVVLPYVFGDLSGVVLASDLDANFNALATAINEGNPATAGSGILINSGGTISFNPVGTSLNGSTIGGNNLQTAFLSLYNAGTQTVPGTVNFSGTLATTGPLGINSNGYYSWQGGNTQTQSVGLQGSIFLNGTIPSSSGASLQNLYLYDELVYPSPGIMDAWNFVHLYGNGATGGRQTLNINMAINQVSTLDVGSRIDFFTAFNPFAEGNAVVPSGATAALFCMNGAAAINAGATGWSTVVWVEADLYAAEPVLNVIGFNLELSPEHAYQGSILDVGLLFTSDETLVGLKQIISVGGPPGSGKGSPIGSNTTAFKVWTNSSGGVQQTGTIQTGLDFSAGYLTITGNLLIANGTTITGSGNASFLSLAWGTGTIAAAGTSQATATAITAQDVVVTSGTGGVRLVNFNNGCECVVRNRVGSTITIYPQSGAQIENAGTNVGLTLPNGTDGRFSPFSNTQWYY